MKRQNLPIYDTKGEKGFKSWKAKGRQQFQGTQKFDESKMKIAGGVEKDGRNRP